MKNLIYSVIWFALAMLGVWFHIYLFQQNVVPPWPLLAFTLWALLNSWMDYEWWRWIRK